MIVRVLVVLTALVAALATQALAADVETIGAWSIRQEKDSLTDKVSVTATAAVGINDALVIACDPAEDPGVRDVFVVHAPYLGFGRRGLTYRMDDAPPVEILAFYRTEGAFLNNPDDYHPFLEALQGAKRVRMRETAATAETIDVDFDVAGADKVLARLSALCDTKRP